MKNSNILWNQAQEYEKTYNYSEAAKFYLKAAKIDLKNGKKKDAATEFGYAATCLYNIGEIDEALKYYKEALAIAEQLGSPNAEIVKENIEVLKSKCGTKLEEKVIQETETISLKTQEDIEKEFQKELASIHYRKNAVRIEYYKHRHYMDTIAIYLPAPDLKEEIRVKGEKLDFILSPNISKPFRVVECCGPIPDMDAPRMSNGCGKFKLYKPNEGKMFEIEPWKREDSQTIVKRALEKIKTIKFDRKETRDVSTYEYYKANSVEDAKKFLKLNMERLIVPNYYIIVKTPEGGWGLDKEGLFLQNLLPWQKKIELAEYTGTIEKMPNQFGLSGAASGQVDNFIAVIVCGNCGNEWKDGVRYQNITVARCPKCKSYNKVDSSFFTVLYPEKITTFRGAQIPQFEADILQEIEKLTKKNFAKKDKIESTTKMGFSTENQRVFGIGLYKRGISTLPESIGNLTSLQRLDLNNNKLSSLPESIGNLKSLEKLNLYGNKLTILPESIGNLTSLRELHLWSNKLSTLPESISNLTSLQKLILMGNKLSTLPESIGNLKSLRVLDLAGNQLSTLPESIGNLTSLQSLNLKINQFTTLPESIKILEKRGVTIYKSLL